MAEVLAATAIKRFPGAAELWLQYAVLPLHRSQADAAVGTFEEVRARFPDYVQAYVFGAQAPLRIGRVEDAEPLLMAAMGGFPKSEHCFIEYAWCASHPQDRKEAIR